MPAVIYDKSIFKMLYAAQGYEKRWQIGLAYSLDGINWFKFSSPVKSRLNYDNRDVHDPSWLFNEEKKLYEMWYASSLNGGATDFRIYHSESIDGIHWTNEHDVIVHQPEASWEIEMVSCPHVLLIDNKYYMWLAGRNSGKWTIGFFTSEDGLNWIPSDKNPVITKTTNLEYPQLISPEVYYDPLNTNGKFNMYYSTNDLGASSSILYAYSNDGSTWTKPILDNPILTKSSIVSSFDQYGVSEASVINKFDSIYIWYGGEYLRSKGIGLAYLGKIPSVLPTPSASLFPTITPTPTTPIVLTPTPIPPTATPTPYEKIPIVIVPGMFASWNKQAMLGSKSSTKKEWKILNFIKEYDGLLQTLKNLGYLESVDLFLWAYDWRQPITQTVSELDNYIRTNVLSASRTKVCLVGHSLGGLVIRAWAQQRNNTNNIKCIIIVGSPNQGAIQPYLAWEGGDLTQNDSIITFSANILKYLNKKFLENDRDTIQRVFPVLKDILPDTPYLLNSINFEPISISSMFTQNSWLQDLNSNLASMASLFSTITGTGLDTPHTYTVTQPSKIDFLLGNWQDGKPIITNMQPGDGTVTSNRSIIPNGKNIIIAKNHNELVSSQEGIEEILKLLSIPYHLEDIVSGKITKTVPSLIFLLQSPATIQITSPNGYTYNDEEGVLFLPNAQDGIYDITIKGVDSGFYRLSVGQFTSTSYLWSNIYKPISNNEAHSYNIVFKQDQPINAFQYLSASDWLQQIHYRLQLLEPISDLPSLQKARISLLLTQKTYEQDNKFIFKIHLEELLKTMSQLRRHSDNISELTFEIDSIIAILFKTVLNENNQLFSYKQLFNDQLYLTKVSSKLLQLININKIQSHYSLLLYNKGVELLKIGKHALVNNILSEASYSFYVAKLLFLEVL